MGNGYKGAWCRCQRRVLNQVLEMDLGVDVAECLWEIAEQSKRNRELNKEKRASVQGYMGMGKCANWGLRCSRLNVWVQGREKRVDNASKSVQLEIQQECDERVLYSSVSHCRVYVFVNKHHLQSKFGYHRFKKFIFR